MGENDWSLTRSKVLFRRSVMVVVRQKALTAPVYIVKYPEVRVIAIQISGQQMAAAALPVCLDYSMILGLRNNKLYSQLSSPPSLQVLPPASVKAQGPFLAISSVSATHYQQAGGMYTVPLPRVPKWDSLASRRVFTPDVEDRSTIFVPLPCQYYIFPMLAENSQHLAILLSQPLKCLGLQLVIVWER